MSLGGELCERYVYLSNPGFGLQGLGMDDYLLHRVLLHTDIHFGEHVRAFISTWEPSGSREAVPFEEDRLDLQQGFADISFDLDSSTRATFRAGRQEFAFGSQRLVSVRDSPNLCRSFDGWVIFDMSDARIDGFAVRPVAAERRIFDDGTNDAQRFWGVYATMPIGFAAGLNADLYYLGFKRDAVRFSEPRRSDAIRSARACGEGTPAGTTTSNWSGSWATLEARTSEHGRLHQTSVSRSAIPCKAAPGSPCRYRQRRRLPERRNAGHVQRDVPKLNYLTEAALVAPANIMDLFPSVTLKLTDSLRMIIGSDFLWRVSKDDAFYASPLNPVPGTSTAYGRYIGNQLELEAEWTIGGHINLNSAYEHFYAGETILLRTRWRRCRLRGRLGNLPLLVGLGFRLILSINAPGKLNSVNVNTLNSFSDGMRL